MSRWRLIWGFAVVIGGACKGGAEPTPDGSARPAPTAEPLAAPIPRDRGGFLRELAPLPHGAVLVVYRLTGPGDLRGTLELIVKRGGLRRENWTVQIPVPGREPQSRRGTVIQTPDLVYSQVPTGAQGDEVAETLGRSPVGPLADAYAALDAARQDRVVAALRAWHRDLAGARGEHPGETRTIAGRACLWTRVAAQSLCIWEEAGVPLYYEGGAFTVEAIRIDVNPQLAADAFEVATGDRAPSPVPTELAIDPTQALTKLEVGKYGAIALALAPGFRPPAGLMTEAD